MRNPREWISDRCRVDLARLLVAEKPVELRVADDVQRGAWDVVALLVAGGDETCADIDADIRLPESVAEDGGSPPIGRHAEHAAVVFSKSRGFLTAFGNDELAA